MMSSSLSHPGHAEKHSGPHRGDAGHSLLPYATRPDIGCGGHLRAHPEHFVVDEIPAYLPSGQGEHLYVLVEKREVSTPQLVSHIKRTFGLSDHHIGYAGLNDAQAGTRQWLSLHTEQDLPLERLESDGITVLQASRHTNKLRPGHLHGNRFRIVVSDAWFDHDLDDILRSLVRHGFPNYFGAQRLGPGGRNAHEGRRLIRRETSTRGPTSRLRFHTNAYQAALFNRILAHRLVTLGDLGRVLVGDLAMRHDSGGCFPVESHAVEIAQQRADRQEISATAPLFGYKTAVADGVPGAWEVEALQAERITPDDFRFPLKRLSARGERRPIRAFPREMSWTYHDDGRHHGLELHFVLPPGTYATTMLREVMKNDDLTDVLDAQA